MGFAATKFSWSLSSETPVEEDNWAAAAEWAEARGADVISSSLGYLTYDPATKKLRKRFEIYPDALRATVKFARDLERTHTELLKRIQAERQRR